MNARMKGMLRAALTAAALVSGAAYAGGPLFVNAATGLKYPGAGSVTLRYDQGLLGSFTNAQAATIVSDAISRWTNVSTATITLARGADLTTDITAANYLTLYNISNDGINPVIYDTNGAIVDTIFGLGAKSNVLGFAGSSYLCPGGPAAPCTYTEGQAVINGFISITAATMTNVLTHEIGHLIGMDHSQLDDSQGLASSNYPTMYPIAYRTLSTLHEDDIAAITALYPETSTIVNAAYGQLTGTFTTAGGVAIQGANIWAQSTTGQTFSYVSDYMMQGTGAFRFLLPPGTYTLHAEAIDTGFTGGSSVGPFSDDWFGASFQPPLYSVGGGASAPTGPMAPVVLGGGVGTQFTITAGCLATATFRINATGSVTGNCDVAPPAAPSIISPNSSIATTLPAFVFNAVANATSYSAEIWGPSGLVTTYTATPTQAGCPANTGQCSIASTLALTNGTSYSWRMKASNSSGASGFSGWLSFSVAIAPATPTAISPTGIIGTATPAFVFNAAANAATYELEVWGPSGIAASYSATPAQAGCPANTGQCSVASTTTLTNGTAYSWRMRAMGGTQSSGYTGWLNFTVSVAPPTPVTVSPSGPITTTTPAFVFTAAANTTSYAVEVWGPAGLAASYSATPAQAGCPGNTGFCSVASTTTLTNGTGYSWRMRALNGASASAYTGWLNFTVSLAPATPTAISPTGTITTGTPAFVFNAAANATSYGVEVWGPTGLAASYTATPAQAGCPTNTGQCSIASTTTLPSAGYSWRMRGLNGSQASAYTGWMNFTVTTALATPMAVSPSGTINTPMPAFVFQPSPGATSYTVEVWGPTGLAASYTATPVQASCPSNTGFCAIPSTVSLGNAGYSWRMKATNGSLSSPFTGWVNFTVTPA